MKEEEKLYEEKHRCAEAESPIIKQKNKPKQAETSDSKLYYIILVCSNIAFLMIGYALGVRSINIPAPTLSLPATTPSPQIISAAQPLSDPQMRPLLEVATQTPTESKETCQFAPSLQQLCDVEKYLTYFNENLPFHMVEVGANDGDYADSNDPVLGFVHNNNFTHGILFEPVPFLYKKLEQKFADFPNIHTVNGVVGSIEEEKDFYYVAEKFARDFPGSPHWMKYQLGSFDRDLVWRQIRYARPRRRDKYVVSKRMMVKNGAGITQEFDLEKIDMLMIDAEGWDDEVVRSFLSVEDLPINFIVFENKHLSKLKNDKLLEELKKSGYRCSNCPLEKPDNTHCQNDYQSRCAS